MTRLARRRIAPAWIVAAAALVIARPAHAQCPFPLPCDAAPADQIACVESGYSIFEDTQNYGVREQEQTSEGLARVVSIRPRVSGSSEAAAGYLALRADSTIVALPPGINRAEMIIEGYWRRSVVITTAGPPLSPIGTMVGLFSWRGGIEQIAVPLTEEAGIPLNGAHAAAMLQIGALDGDFCSPIAEIVRTDSSCSGRRVLEVPPCSGDAFVDEILQVEVPFTFGQPFHLFGYARLDADVMNFDSAIADDFFGGARADFGSTGRWMGILEVRDFLGAPVADYTITDLATGDVDWTQPVPEPGSGAAISAAIASLCLLRSRRVRRNGSAALAVATLLVAASPARASVQLSTEYPPTAWVASSFDLIDSSSPECLEEFCFAQLRDLATFALLDAQTSTVSFEDAVPAFEAELDQSYTVQFTFEDTPLGPTLAGGSASITSASRGVATASSVPDLEGARTTGVVGLEWALEVDAPVYLYVFGSAALIGGPLEDREIADPLLCPPLPPGDLCDLRPYPRVSVGATPFHFAPSQESEIGAFDSGELVLAPGIYGFAASAGHANVVPIVVDAPETHLVQEDLDFEFVIVPVPEPGAGVAALVALASLVAARRRGRRRIVAILAVALGAASFPAHSEVTYSSIQRNVGAGVSLSGYDTGSYDSIGLFDADPGLYVAAAEEEGLGAGEATAFFDWTWADAELGTIEASISAAASAKLLGIPPADGVLGETSAIVDINLCFEVTQTAALFRFVFTTSRPIEPIPLYEQPPDWFGCIRVDGPNGPEIPFQCDADLLEEVQLEPGYSCARVYLAAGVRAFGSDLPPPQIEDQAEADLFFETLVPEPGAFAQGLVALLVLLAPLIGGAARAAIHFVPNEDGEDEFRAAVRSSVIESGPICDPIVPTLAAATGGLLCGGEDEGEEGDLLEEALASGSFGAATDAVAILTAVSARANARYEITWDTLGPSLAIGHVELEVRGETEADDAPFGSAREAYSYADARVQLCFRVEDEPVSVRLVGLWQGALSDVASELAVPDFGLITIDPSGPRVTSPAIFDTGPHVVTPGPLRQCIRALLTADETLLADPTAIVPDWTEASSLSFDFTIQPGPVPEPGALLQGLAVLAALLGIGVRRR